MALKVGALAYEKIPKKKIYIFKKSSYYRLIVEKLTKIFLLKVSFTISIKNSCLD